jgi:hypothetical protein
MLPGCPGRNRRASATGFVLNRPRLTRSTSLAFAQTVIMPLHRLMLLRNTYADATTASNSDRFSSSEASPFLMTPKVHSRFRQGGRKLLPKLHGTEETLAVRTNGFTRDVLGTISQGTPLTGTNTIAVNALSGH